MTDTNAKPAATKPADKRPRRTARQPAAKGTAQQAAATPAPATSPGPSKTAQAEALLRRPEGATLAELVAATGWLPHTTRAHLTGLRKKGRVLDKSKRDDATCYRIVEAA